jgi:hypothetical protein
MHNKTSRCRTGVFLQLEKCFTTFTVEDAMKEFTHKIVSAAAPVVGVSISMALLNAATLGFPP